MMRAGTLRRVLRGDSVVRSLLAITAAVVVSACAGGGKNRDFSLPAGENLDSVRSDKVMVVVESHNECGNDNNCVAVPSGPCHLGSGNTRGLAVYRLGASGLFFENSPEGSNPEQRIATDDNPRRVVVNPKDSTLLYVATKQRIQVVRLRAGGGSACIGETKADKEVKDGANDNDPVDMVVDPNFGNGILYVAGRGSSRVDAYPIADDGTIPDLPTSCIVGGGNAEFTSLTPLSDGFFAAGGAVRVEIHARLQGQFLPEPDTRATVTPTPFPTVSPSPAPGETPGPTEPSPAPSTCIGSSFVSTPLSTLDSAIVTQMQFSPSASVPLGTLFLAEEVSQRIFTFPVNADGIFDENDSSRTDQVGIYQRMLRHQTPTLDIIYSTVFDQGRVDVFLLQDGLLPNKNFSRTAQDPKTFPVGLAIDGPSGKILYVTEGGYDRVDGFLIRDDGGLPDEPVTSTAPPTDATGRSLDTFPDDIAIVPLP